MVQAVVHIDRSRHATDMQFYQRRLEIENDETRHMQRMLDEREGQSILRVSKTLRRYKTPTIVLLLYGREGQVFARDRSQQCICSSEKELKALTSFRCVLQQFIILKPEVIVTRIEFGQCRGAEGSRECLAALRTNAAVE